MSLDLRGFNYPLYPVIHLRKCQLEVLRARLGSANKQVREAKDLCEQLRLRYDEQSRFASSLLVDRGDISAYRRMLQWLARLHEEIRVASDSLWACERRRDELRDKCVRQQQKLDVIEKHREECQFEFAVESQNRFSIEADREWLSRRASRLGDLSANGVGAAARRFGVSGQ